jgi:purine-binding chemotaxis protein CheW
MSDSEVDVVTQYLSFKLGEEVFAVDISKVREVLDFTTVTKVPQTPDYMRGVINLRGGVVPVVDLKLKFGMEETEKTVNTCIIIAEVALEGESVVLGALADSVQEVFDLKPEDIEPAPKIGTQLNTEFLTGMGKKNDEFILLLDIDRVFTTEEISMVQSIGEAAEEEE